MKFIKQFLNKQPEKDEEISIRIVQLTKSLLEKEIRTHGQTIIDILKRASIKDKLDQSHRAKIKELYKKIIDDEAALIESKLLIQMVNLGGSGIDLIVLSKSNYINIYELDTLENRRRLLDSIQKYVNGPKLKREIASIDKRISKSQERIEEFNKRNKFKKLDLSSLLLKVIKHIAF